MISKKTKVRVYYHISAIDLGRKVTLISKVPELAGPTECKETARVCFAPSLTQALVSVLGIGERATISAAAMELLPHKWPKAGSITNRAVYITRSRLLTTPKAISGDNDLLFCGEMWSTRDIAVTRLGYIDTRALMFDRCVRLTAEPHAKLAEDEFTLWKTIVASTWTKVHAPRKGRAV